MKKLKTWEDIEPELNRILSEAKNLANDLRQMEQKVEDVAEDGLIYEPIGAAEIDLEYLKYKARRVMRKTPPSGSLS